jgi:hypothetical protein
VDRHQLEAWLAEYGNAWQDRDSRAFVSLFAPEVLYHWTPFEEPKRGRDVLAAAFDAAVARQASIRFSSAVLAVDERSGIASWRCSFERVGTGRQVQLDGIFQMEFDNGGSCTVFREWWHSDEFLRPP